MKNKDIEVENEVAETTVDLRIAKAISSVKRTSERVVGITQTDYTYTRLTFDGTTIRPEPITPMERAIVGIIDIDDDASFENVGKILGIDVEHDNAEKAMLLEAISKMKGYGMIEGNESYYSLTEKGKVFAKEGERPVTYNKTFSISYDTNHPNYVHLDADFSSSKTLSEKKPLPDGTPDGLGIIDDLSRIKVFAEIQCPSVQNEKNRYVLQSAIIRGVETIQANVYVIILQSIRNEEDYRVFVYDDAQGSFLPYFSELIQSDTKWTSLLLEQCIDNSLKLSEEDGGWTIVSPEQEKDASQKAIEAELVQSEDNEANGDEIEGNELERLHKKALYDQVSFEFELDKIFRQDNPDEVWIISPFVSWSFVKVRVKQFEPLLKTNKRIFIAYSEPYGSRPTISPEAERAIKNEINRLSKTYSNFYYVELPKFHTKQVLEVKNGQCVLFNGSFNVLSFDNVSVGRKVSREEMALVHHQIATSKHQEYIDTFARIYEKRILDEINSNSDAKVIANIKSDRIDYLHQIADDKGKFVDFYTEYDEKTFLAKNNAWYDDSETLVEKINQAATEGFIDVKDFNAINVSYSALIKNSVALTISKDAINKLDEAYSTIENLPKKKDKTLSSASYSMLERARTIIDSFNFDDEDDVTRYVAALYFLYTKRAFKTATVGTKYLRILIDNDTARSHFSVLDFSLNKNSKAYDITVGIGGYSFRLYGICQLNMKAKLDAIKKPKESSMRLSYINSNNIEQVLNDFINQ